MNIPWTVFFLSNCTGLVLGLTRSLHLSVLQTSSTQDKSSFPCRGWPYVQFAWDKQGQAGPACRVETGFLLTRPTSSLWADTKPQGNSIFAVSSSLHWVPTPMTGQETVETGSKGKMSLQWTLGTTRLFHSLLFQERPVPHDVHENSYATPWWNMTFSLYKQPALGGPRLCCFCRSPCLRVSYLKPMAASGLPLTMLPISLPIPQSRDTEVSRTLGTSQSLQPIVLSSTILVGQADPWMPPPPLPGSGKQRLWKVSEHRVF